MHTNITSSVNAPLAHSISESRRLLGGIGNTTFFELVKAGELRTIKIRGRSLVLHDDLVGLINRKIAESATGAKEVA